ncbi:transglycosylase SLT domain-containing protein [Roseinatronobacter sp.]|uniref:transglycosylase SLT domain-containing protein n=1 Tax=Roseinatronobacter sp. TaxID=1945755 RepID=UPI0025EA877F|nr:transglycosylase SLT domain-containing protein [Roseibaca sp.]
MPEPRLARFGLKPSRLCGAAAFALLIAIFAWPVLAKSDAALCTQAAQTAARKHGVPLNVLRTVALLETGRSQGGRLRPWPWALNAGGKSHWLTSKAKAKATARAILDTGQRNLDFGCFQLNYHWHGKNFSSLDAMLDPVQNADYAARFLLGHYQRLGDWKAAVGAYHSRTPKHAARYLARYDSVIAQVPPVPANPQTPARQSGNSFALLSGADRNAGGGARGSIVPASVLNGSTPLIQLGGSAP